MGTTAGLLLALGLLAGACGGAAGEPEPAGAVTLVDAGAEPRRPLDLAPEEGISTTVTMAFDMQMGVRVDGAEQAVPSIPTMTIDTDVTVAEVTEDRITSTYTFGDVRLPDGADPALAEAFRGFGGTTGTITTTRSGVVVDSQLEIPDDVNPQMATTLEEFDRQMAALTVPLPAEPVGAGAVWTARTDVDVQGMRTTQTATYTLEEFDGDRYVLDVELEQEIAPATVTEQGTTVEVLGGGGTGEGRTVGSLTFPMAVEGDLTVDSDVRMQIDTPSGAQELEQSIRMRMRMSSV